MEYQTFEYNFLSKLHYQNPECIQDIDMNVPIIQRYLGGNDVNCVKQFVNKFNDTVVQQNNFSLFERILYHPLFTAVINEFRNSDILIKGCRSGNVSALQWLLNLNINPRIQDENGMTALMHASLNPQLLFVVQRLLTINDESKNYVDNKNENALFYAVRNPQAFEKLLAAQINPNILNKDRDSILTYCCRNKLYDVVEKLLNKNQVQHIILDLNVVNNEEKTAAMYLVEDGRSNEFNSFLHTNVNFDYINSRGESVLTKLIEKYYMCYKSEKVEEMANYQNILRILVDQGCDINASIDNDRNTPMMFFMMMEDWHTIVYLLLRCKSLDLTQKNNFGINASYLSAELVESERSKSNNIIVDNVNRLIINRDTFDICFKDQFGNSLLMNYIYFNQVNGLYVLLGKDKNLGNEVNLGRESPLIFATKLGRDECIKALIKSEVNLNYQDSLGNTALHYAVEANNRYIVSLLVFYKADKTIKNNKGLSPVELAKSLDYQKIIKYFKKPVNPAEILKKEKKKNKGTMGNEKSNEYSEQFKTIIYHQPQCVPSSNLEFVNQMQKNGRKIYKALNYEGEAEVSISEVYSEDFTSEVNLPIVGGANMGARKLGRDWDWDTTVDEVTGSMKGIFKFVENLL